MYKRQAVHVPTLRELGDDKTLLREHFTAFYAKQIGQAPFTLDASAQARWLEYNFPGNVRELRNIVIRLIAKYSGKTLNAQDLIAEFDLSKPDSDGSSSEPINFNDESGMMTQAQRHLQSQANVTLDAVLKTWEKAYIDAAMKITHGNLSQAAKLLNVNRTTLYSRMSTPDNS